MMAFKSIHIGYSQNFHNVIVTLTTMGMLKKTQWIFIIVLHWEITEFHKVIIVRVNHSESEETDNYYGFV